MMLDGLKRHCFWKIKTLLTIKKIGNDIVSGKQKHYWQSQK